MKKYLFLIVVITFGFSINRLFDEKVKNLLVQLKLTEDEAEQNIFWGLSGPSFYIPSIARLKNIAAGERPAYVSLIGDYTRQYTASDEFIKKYNEYRETKKPSPPEKPQSVSEMKENYRKQLEESIINTEKMIQQMPDMKETFEESRKSMQQQLADLDNPDNPMFNPEMDKMMMDSYNQQMELHRQEIAKWEEEYPAGNPNKMIKKWLTNFLELSKDIDFSTQLATNQNGKQVFVNSAYEKKSNAWKLCFRAGKETVQTARAFAENWMKELN